MNYKLTVLTPLLVGDGQKLSPIDYMVWKDQVNVLDQRRIFRLLAKGPRLEGYLSQLRRAEKLDFASWGGFAQNFAGRRIPFEHASSTGFWNDARPESLHIPTFCSGPRGAFLPASAIKGALRTGVVYDRASVGTLKEIGARMEGDRPPRRPGEALESMTLGAAGADPLRLIAMSDSSVVPATAFRVFLVRVTTLNQRGPDKFELGWKQAQRAGSAGPKPENGTPMFAEMAAPGTSFTGTWTEREFLRRPEISKNLHRRENFGVDRIARAANEYAKSVLAAQIQYAQSAGLTHVVNSLNQLEAQRSGLTGNSCLVNIGWGGGFLGKAAFVDTADDEYRRVLRTLPYYAKAIRSGMPFPKTRRVVFMGNQPAALPGWALLEL